MPEAQLALVLVGTNHRHAPIGVREQLAARDARPRADRGDDGGGRRDGGASASPPATAARSTWSAPMRRRCATAAVSRLAAYAHRSARRSFEPLLYTLEGMAVAEHLFAVAGRPGLDGAGRGADPRQIRDAYADALEMGSTGPVSNRLFHQALEAGKRVRHETAIGELNASVASVAAQVGPRPAGVAGRRRGADRRRRQGRRAGRHQPARPRRPRDHGGRTAAPTAARRWPCGSAAGRSAWTSCRRSRRRPTSSSPRRCPTAT